MPEKLKTPKVRVALVAADAESARNRDDDWALVSALLDRGYAVSRTDGEVSLANDETLIVVNGDGRDVSSADGRGGIAVVARDERTVSRIDALLAERNVRPNQPGDGQWKPWFPVIDYDRCTNCLQCLSFCLFDVFGVDAKNRIQVQNNDNCKTDCPACSRVCPEMAIMFPKYPEGPINGEDVSDAEVNREAMPVDIAGVLGGDIYASLRERHETARQRFAKQRDDKQALSERMRCLSKLRGEMDIPMEIGRASCRERV